MQTPNDPTPAKESNRLLLHAAAVTGSRFLLLRWAQREWERQLADLPPLAEDDDLDNLPF